MNKETGAKVEAGFRRSPVRIGRNPLNDLAIDESFVSQWHGLLRFDEESTGFLDLGSTNGTKVEGHRLEKNVEVAVTPETHLAIGPLRITVARLALTDEQILPRRASAFTLGGTQRAQRGVGDGGTVELASTHGTAGPLGATMSDDGPSPKQQLIEMAQRQRALVEQITPLYQALEVAQRALEDAMQAGLADSPTASERETRLELLRTQFPNAFATAAPAGAGMGEHGQAGSGVDINGWIERLAPGASAGWAEPERALERAGAILEGFASAYADLKVGQKQVRGDLGLEDTTEPDGLPRFDDSRQLLAYLLDGNADALMRLDELARSFAGLAVHQLAMVAGAVDGAMAILQQVSPQALGAAAPGAIVKTSFGFGDFVWPFAAAGHYYRFAAKHLELSTGQRFTTHLFGAAFGRAYYRVIGRSG